jgi:hypothetical protein
MTLHSHHLYLSLTRSLPPSFTDTPLIELQNYSEFWKQHTIDRISAITRFNNSIKNYCIKIGCTNASLQRFFYARCCAKVRKQNIPVSEAKTYELCHEVKEELFFHRNKVLSNYMKRYDMITLDEVDMDAFSVHFSMLIEEYVRKISLKTYDIHEI